MEQTYGLWGYHQCTAYATTYVPQKQEKSRFAKTLKLLPHIVNIQEMKPNEEAIADARELMQATQKPHENQK